MREVLIDVVGRPLSSFGFDCVVMSLATGSTAHAFTCSGSVMLPFFVSGRRRHTRWPRDWSSDVCSSDLHDLLFVDVPPGATALEVEVSGPAGISGQLFRLDHDDVFGAAPGTPPAPSEGALDEGRDTGSGFVLGHSSSSGIPAGRYYVVLDNNFASGRRELGRAS